MDYHDTGLIILQLEAVQKLCFSIPCKSVTPTRSSAEVSGGASLAALNLKFRKLYVVIDKSCLKMFCILDNYYGKIK